MGFYGIYMDLPSGFHDMMASGNRGIPLNHPLIDGIFMDFPLETIQSWGYLFQETTIL